MNRYAASSSSRLLRSHFSKSFSLRKKVPWWYQILDPKSEFVDRWNRTFLYASFLALFLDPLYFYFPIIGKENCMKIDLVLGVFITFFRTLNDIFFVFHIVLKFRTAYFSSFSFGRGDLITDPYLIAIRYLKTDFSFDFLACLPLPQNYWQSTTARLKEWRIKQRDTEEWMRHRQLPPELQERVRRFVQYKWLASGGVDEETILRSLPLDLRRQIQRHICLALVRRVPFFGQMDDQLLDAICERLVSSLNTKDTYLLREGDPVKEMIFIIRGQVESATTDGGRSGFFNSITLRPGDFCGEELLTWALVPTSSSLPSSTRTVKTLTELEAFALRAEDMRFFGIQFKRLHSKKIQHAFRYYSHQWRAWGACFIQAAWRRHVKKKLAMELLEKENLLELAEPAGEESASVVVSSTVKAAIGGSLATTLLASKFAKNTRRGALRQKLKIPDESSLKMPKLFKPSDPDFSAE